MTAALSSHRALSTQRLNAISADSDDVIKTVSAKLGQLKQHEEEEEEEEVSQSVGLDLVESTF